jgi:SOS-response transcriptional repressor LexA
MKTIPVPIRGRVNGGTPIPNDWSSFAAETIREIRPIKGIPADKLYVSQVDGQSLQKLGIFNNDWLVCYETSKYIPGKLAIWNTPHGETVKFAFVDKEGAVVLHNHSGWEQKWEPEEVSLVSIVARIERDLL